MEKSLFKKIVNACGAVLSVVMILFIKVGITLKSKYETSNALYKGYFEFVNDASKVDTYGFARFCMIFGFVLACVCAFYFVSILVLDLLKQKRLINKLNLITKIMEFVLIGSVVIVLMAGLDKLEYGDSGFVNHISLFGIYWTLSFVFSSIPFASKYLMK